MASNDVTSFVPKHILEGTNYGMWVSRMHEENQTRSLCKVVYNNFLKTPYVAMVICLTSCNKDLNSSIWIINSGCTNHISNSKSLYITLYLDYNDVLIVGDKSQIIVEGIGNVRIGKNILNEVLYVPNLATNIIYVRKKISQGKNIHFKDNGCFIKKW